MSIKFKEAFIFRPERGMKVFVPQSCAVIDRLSKDGIGKNEKIDEELKFNILILSEVSSSPFKIQHSHTFRGQ